MKRYLKTPEEIIDALTEGKTIVDMLGFKYSLYRGVIIKKGEYSSEAGSSVMIDFYPYVEEYEPFKMEENKHIDKRIEKAAFAVFKIDFPMLELDDWMHFSEKVKGIYYMRAEAAINAYQNQNYEE